MLSRAVSALLLIAFAGHLWGCTTSKHYDSFDSARVSASGRLRDRQVAPPAVAFPLGRVHAQ